MQQHNDSKDDEFRSRFDIRGRIGSGSFGQVYGGVDKINNDNPIAVKFQKRSQDSMSWKREKIAYRTMSGLPGFCKIYYEGFIDTSSNDKTDVLVMDQLGDNLEELFRYCNKRFSLKTVLLLADQMISRLQTLHSQNFIHRDLKPENFVIGPNCETDTQIYLIDFGCASKYFDEIINAHKPYRDGKSLTGTIRYMSLNSHLGYETSRRDDLISLGYIFIYFLKSSLPWQSGYVQQSQKSEYVASLKQNISTEELCRGLPIEFTNYLNYVLELRYDEKPDYRRLRRSFQTLFFRQRFQFGGMKFDWQNSNNNNNGIYSHLSGSST